MWYPEVSALDDKIDLGEHTAHLRKAGGMMAEIVGSWKRVEGREDRSGYECRGHCLSASVRSHNAVVFPRIHRDQCEHEKAVALVMIESRSPPCLEANYELQ